MILWILIFDFCCEKGQVFVHSYCDEVWLYRLGWKGVISVWPMIGCAAVRGGGWQSLVIWYPVSSTKISFQSVSC